MLLRRVTEAALPAGHVLAQLSFGIKSLWDQGTTGEWANGFSQLSFSMSLFRYLPPALEQDMSMASDIQQQLLLPFKDSDGGNVSICPLGCHIVGSFNPAQFRHMIKLVINSRSIRL